MLGNTESATIGIIDADGNYGLEVIYNDIFIEDELSLIFDSTPSWVSLNLLSGNQSQLFQGESANYNINVNTENLNQGSYQAYLIVNTNISSVPDIFPIILNTQEEFLIGDVNQDGVLDVLDIVRIISIIMGSYNPSSLEILLSDTNGDGVVNVIDIVLLVNLILSS